jgi:hypothetical protein
MVDCASLELRRDGIVQPTHRFTELSNVTIRGRLRTKQDDLAHAARVALRHPLGEQCLRRSPTTVA